MSGDLSRACARGHRRCQYRPPGPGASVDRVSPNSAPPSEATRTALISSDRAFREMVKDVFLSHEGWTAPALEITAHFDAFGEEQVRALRQLRPELITPRHRSSGAGHQVRPVPRRDLPGIRFVATGPLLQPEHLLTAMRAGVADYLPKPVTTEAFRAALDRIRVGLGSTKKAEARRPARSTPSTAPRGRRHDHDGHELRRECSTGSPARRPCWWTWTSSSARSPCSLASSRASTSWTWCRTSTGWTPSCWPRTSSGTSPGVHLLSAPYHPEKAEVVTAEEIRRILQFLRKHYDYLVVDTSKSFSPATLASLEQADLAFVVTNVDLASLRNLQRGLPLLKRMLRPGREAHPPGREPLPSRQRDLAGGRPADARYNGVPHAVQRLR